MDHELSKIKRLIRPLVSKIHRITELYLRNPNLLHTKGTLDPSNNSKERLLALKLFIDDDLYDEYHGLFSIFQSVVMILSKVYDSTSTTGHSTDYHGSLSTLCCLSVGKHIAVGSKSSYFKLNQAILFENDNGHLQNGDDGPGDEVPDDIEDWFSMEPSYIFGKYRFPLLMGYLVHLLVFNTNVLYMLIPVIVEWLMEQYYLIQIQTDDPKSIHYHLMGQHLFRKYWMFNYKDYSNQWDHHATYWSLVDIGYWDTLFQRLDIPSTAHYNLYMDHLTLNHRVDLNHLSCILLWLERCPQHHHSTEILALLVKEIISGCKVKHSSVSQLESIYKLSLTHLLAVAQTWLFFKPDAKTMVYDSLLPGNELIFSSLIHCCKYIRSMSGTIYNKRTKSSFKSMYKEAERMMKTFTLLKAYYLDTSLECMPLESETISLGDSIILWFTDGNHHIDFNVDDTLSNGQFNDFLCWLKEEGAIGLSQYLFRAYYNDDLFELEIEDLFDTLFE